MSDEIRDPVDQIRHVTRKPNAAPKRKDIWEKLAIIASFVSTVGLAAVAVGLGIYIHQAEADRAAAFEQTQIELETAQTDIEELRSLVAPLLAMDTAVRRLENQVLEAVSDQGGYTVFEKASGLPLPVNLTATRIQRERAVRALNVPPEVARVARKVLEGIKPLSAAEAIAAIQHDTSSRVVDEIILHHTATPAGSYNGVLSVVRLAEFQVYQNWWSQVSWHFAVAPDGSIWLGTPLGKPAIHTPDRQNTTVSVLLIMNGDKELPSDAQRAAVGAVLRALLARYQLAPETNFMAGRGLHREHTRNQKCPGTLITHELVLDWIAAAT